MKLIAEKIANLFSVKSIVTIILTVVFSLMSLNGTLTQEFLTIYSVIIAFYFGTQHEKNMAEKKTNENITQEETMNPQEIIIDSPQINETNVKI